MKGAKDLIINDKFNFLSEFDDESKVDTPINKLPSYTAMCEFAVEENANWISKTVAWLVQLYSYCAIKLLNLSTLLIES
jgi:hypothetical protein